MSKNKSVLSLWVFQNKREDFDESTFEEEFGIEDLNEDYLEVGGSDEWAEQPIRDVLSGMSVSESWIKQAIEKAASMGIEKCRRALIVLDLDYAPKLSSNPPDNPTFVGVFKYEY